MRRYFIFCQHIHYSGHAHGRQKAVRSKGEHTVVGRRSRSYPSLRIAMCGQKRGNSPSWINISAHIHVAILPQDEVLQLEIK